MTLDQLSITKATTNDNSIDVKGKRDCQNMKMDRKTNDTCLYFKEIIN